MPTEPLHLLLPFLVTALRWRRAAAPGDALVGPGRPAGADPQHRQYDHVGDELHAHRPVGVADQRPQRAAHDAAFVDQPRRVPDLVAPARDEIGLGQQRRRLTRHAGRQQRHQPVRDPEQPCRPGSRPGRDRAATIPGRRSRCRARRPATASASPRCSRPRCRRGTARPRRLRATRPPSRRWPAPAASGRRRRPPRPMAFICRATSRPWLAIQMLCQPSMTTATDNTPALKTSWPLPGKASDRAPAKTATTPAPSTPAPMPPAIQRAATGDATRRGEHDADDQAGFEDLAKDDQQRGQHRLLRRRPC